MKGMFNGCTSLESIDLSNFKAPLRANLNEAFFHCSSLKSIDLSKLESQTLSNIECIFCSCSSWIYLDISGLNFENTKESSKMFFNTGNLKYINLYDINVSEGFLQDLTGEFGINNKENLIVCQSQKFITNEKAKFIYCDFDVEKGICSPSNYISVYYKEDTTYTYGFQYNSQHQEIEERKNMHSIIYFNTTYINKNKLVIKAKTEIKIYFFLLPEV